MLMSLKTDKKFQNILDIARQNEWSVVVKKPRKGKPLTHFEIEHTSKNRLWCGPAAVAAITGSDTETINNLVRKYRKEPKSRVMGTTIYELEYAFAKLGFPMQYAFLYSAGACPTFSEWIRQTKRHLVKDVAYLIGLSKGNHGHWVVVMNGKYICSVSEEWRPLGKAMFRGYKVDGVFSIRRA